jgi:hypothetical protein
MTCGLWLNLLLVEASEPDLSHFVTMSMLQLPSELKQRLLSCPSRSLGKKIIIGVLMVKEKDDVSVSVKEVWTGDEAYTGQSLTLLS